MHHLTLREGGLFFSSLIFCATGQPNNKHAMFAFRRCTATATLSRHAREPAVLSAQHTVHNCAAPLYLLHSCLTSSLRRSVIKPCDQGYRRAFAERFGTLSEPGAVLEFRKGRTRCSAAALVDMKREGCGAVYAALTQNANNSAPEVCKHAQSSGSTCHMYLETSPTCNALIVSAFNSLNCTGQQLHH